jgi:hypothetical protein
VCFLLAAALPRWELRGNVRMVIGPYRHMSFDAKAIFANLSEQERIKGHHSPEGRAIRTLSRALQGWSSGDLSAGDAVVLCDQATEDWLKARLRVSAWSSKGLAELLAGAVEANLLTQADALRLQRLRRLRAASTPATMTAADAEEALKFCIEIVEKHW